MLVVPPLIARFLLIQLTCFPHSFSSEAGKYANGTGNSAYSRCSSGRFIIDAGKEAVLHDESSDCSPCPRDMISPRTTDNSVDCSVAESGYYMSTSEDGDDYNPTCKPDAPIDNTAHTGNGNAVCPLPDGVLDRFGLDVNGRPGALVGREKARRAD